MNAAHAAFAVKKLFFQRDVREYREFLVNQFLPPEVLAARQRERAIAIARWAMEASPFYRDYYSAAGFKRSDLDDPAAFEELPFVEKAHVRDNFDAFKTPEATERNAIVSKSGGSTGHPTRIMRDLRWSARPTEWRQFSWWGIHPADDMALVQRLINTPREYAIRRAQWWPSARLHLDADRLNETTVRRFVETEWQKTKPTFMNGYAGGVLEFARIVTRLGLEPHPAIAIATTSAALTDGQRDEVTAAFGAPVYDQYRSSEIPWIGAECRVREGHHVTSDVRLIEIVDPDGRDAGHDYGDVIGTDLTNRVFPIVRYRLGDRTRRIAEPCPCGVTLPRIERVVGRIGDGLRLPDGTWVALEGLSMVFAYTTAAVAQYQLHQHADYSVEVRCITKDVPDASEQIERAIEVLRGRLDHKVPVSWHPVDVIPHDGGKIRTVISELVSGSAR